MPANDHDGGGPHASAEPHAPDDQTTPWWYHPALGLLTGGLVAAFGWWAASPWAPSALVLLVPLGLFAVGMAALNGAHPGPTGLPVGGFRSSWTGPSIAWKLTAMVAIIVTYIFGWLFGWAWVPIVAGAALVPAAMLIGRWYDADLRRAQLTG